MTPESAFPYSVLPYSFLSWRKHPEWFVHLQAGIFLFSPDPPPLWHHPLHLIQTAPVSVITVPTLLSQQSQ